jgi:hypothetical protein
MKRVGFALSVIAAMAALPANGMGGRHVQTEVDPYSHVKRVWLELPTHVCALRTTRNELAADVRLVINAFHDPDGHVEYAVAVDVDDDHLMHVGSHTKMITAMDERVDTLSLAADKDKWSEHSAFTGARHVRLVMPFAVDREFLVALTKARTFQFRVDSRSDELERCSSGSDLREVRGFLQAAGAP